MERVRSGCTRLCILAVYMSILATTHLTLCEAKTLLEMFEFGGQELHTSSVIDAINDVKAVSNDELNMNPAISNDGISYPFSLVPFESLGPLPSPEDTPPFCVFPPIFTPHPPPNSYGQPSPTPPFYFPPFPNQTPPPPGHTPTPPTPVQRPPHSNPTPPTPVQRPPHSNPSPPTPSPPHHGPSPPTPSPPHHGPSPPKQAHSPPKHGPSPPVYQPPVVFPPPPPHKRPDFAVWCVAKPTVPDTIIQEAMDYACGSGADCKSIQPNGPCFKPNTVIAHASYAFNSYWQRTKVAGGTCDFGGSAMIVTVDPSFDGCQFIYN